MNQCICNEYLLPTIYHLSRLIRNCFDTRCSARTVARTLEGDGGRFRSHDTIRIRRSRGHRSRGQVVARCSGRCTGGWLAKGANASALQSKRELSQLNIDPVIRAALSVPLSSEFPPPSAPFAHSVRPSVRLSSFFPLLSLSLSLSLSFSPPLPCIYFN